jgi:RNA polymerase sigma-70 factor (ECF subfamily)
VADTSLSLLDRLAEPEPGEAWERLVEIYTPLIRGWLERQANLGAEADDLVQEVLAVVVRRVREFEHNGRHGAFRCWLRTITANCLRDYFRQGRRRPHAAGGSEFQAVLEQLADSDSALSKAFDEEHDRHVTQKLLALIRPQFEPATWRAFERVALDGLRAEVVARELNLTVNAVFIAKSRVLSRLRKVGKGLIE